MGPFFISTTSDLNDEGNPMKNSDRRTTKRFPIQVLVNCLPPGTPRKRNGHARSGWEMWAQDLGDDGVGLQWSHEWANRSYVPDLRVMDERPGRRRRRPSRASPEKRLRRHLDGLVYNEKGAKAMRGRIQWSQRLEGRPHLRIRSPDHLSRPPQLFPRPRRVAHAPCPTGVLKFNEYFPGVPHLRGRRTQTMKQLFAIATLSLITFAPAVWAIPTEINYQGTLRGQGGAPINSATTPTTVKFTLTSSDGNTPYSNTITMNPVIINGLFSVKLDFQLIPGNTWESLTPYIKVNVGGQDLTPTEKVSATAYSLVSNSVVDGAITTSKIADGAISCKVRSLSPNFYGTCWCYYGFCRSKITYRLALV